MIMRKFLLGICLVAAGISLTSRARADSLPTFEDFRRVDRTRRMTGQMQSEELLKVTRIDPGLIAAGDLDELPRPGRWKIRSVKHKAVMVLANPEVAGHSGGELIGAHGVHRI